MNDEIFNAKRMLDETNALWGMFLSAFYPDEKEQARLAYREAVREASERIVAALED